jgi:maleylacetoacetate isomerase/maleylpyruvate isomerase
MQLYSYFRSSAAYRVRIALSLKGLPFDYRAVHLLKKEQLAEPYASLAPSRLVPLLRDGEHTLSQSLAIVEYLDETHPQPPLLPADPAGRARVRSLAMDIACEIHPLANLRVLRYLVHEMKLGEEDKLRWIRHWVEGGLSAIEQRLAAAPARFCHGDSPTLADCTLVPQVFNAERFDCRLDALPHVRRVVDTCRALPAFAAAHPSQCPDAE